MTAGQSVSTLREPSRLPDSGPRRDDESPTTAPSRLVRVAYAPAVWLTALVGLSAAVRGGLGLRVPTAWILPDEIVYSELAKSIAAGQRPAVRGVPVFGWGEVYPTLIAPAWALMDDPVKAYHGALLISALVMSLAAVPAYLLARLFLGRGASYLVAVMSVLVPSMAYTGVVMTENACYPVFLLAVLLIARAVQSPSVARQAVAFLGLGLLAFTRIQGLALVGAYLVAIVLYAVTGEHADRRAYLRRFVLSAVVLIVAPLGPVAVSIAGGDGPFGWLGSRSNTFAEFHAREVPEWFAYLTSDLILYVAVAPVAATVVVLARGLSRGSPERIRLFAAVALPTFAAMLGSVSLVSASLDVDGTANLNERYVFYVVPLLFVGLSLWVREGLPRRRPWALVVVVSCCVLAVVLPIDRLHYNSGFQSVALVPWIVLSASGAALTALVAAFTLACGALWLTCKRERVGRLWLLVGVWMALVGALTVGSNDSSARSAAGTYAGLSATWVNDAIPAGSDVPVLWDENLAASNGPDSLYFWVMTTELSNPALGDVYRVGPPTYYETFLPTVPARVGPGGTILDEHGRPIETRFVLVSCRTPVQGKIVAEAPRGALRLVEVDGPVTLSGAGGCPRARP